MKSTVKQILEEIEAFLARRNMNATTFGEQALADRAFVFRLRDGHDVRASTIDRVRSYMVEVDKKPPPKKTDEVCHA